MKTAYKPVRRIGSSRSSLCGTIPSLKNDTIHQFESSLERDFIELNEFDNNVNHFIEQPLTIEYVDEGILRNYTPDFLVYYRNDIEPANKYSPLLCEIKYAAELKEDKSINRVKFEAASEFAAAKGWRFMVLTEKEIRTPYLKNVKFLSGYKDSNLTKNDDFTLLLVTMNALRISSPYELVISCTRCQDKRPELLYTLWYMIANGFIACDLTNLITMKTEIWAKLFI